MLAALWEIPKLLIFFEKNLGAFEKKKQKTNFLKKTGGHFKKKPNFLTKNMYIKNLIKSKDSINNKGITCYFKNHVSSTNNYINYKYIRDKLND